MTNIWLKALRNNYLPAFLLMMLAMSANAQVDQIYPQYGGVFKRITADSSFSFPTGCGAPSGLKRTDNNKAGLYYDSCNAKGYIYDPKLNTWGEIGSGSSGAVASVFGRTGTVTAQAGDYSSFYAPITRTLTINGNTQSFGSDLSFTIAGGSGANFGEADTLLTANRYANLNGFEFAFKNGTLRAGKRDSVGIRYNYDWSAALSEWTVSGTTPTVSGGKTNINGSTTLTAPFRTGVENWHVTQTIITKAKSNTVQKFSIALVPDITAAILTRKATWSLEDTAGYMNYFINSGATTPDYSNRNQIYYVWSANDTLDLSFTYRSGKVVATMTNRGNGQVSRLDYSVVSAANISQIQIIVNGNFDLLDNFKYYIDEPKPEFVTTGNSLTIGSGATFKYNRWTERLFENYSNNYLVAAGATERSAQLLLRIPEFRDVLRPTHVLVDYGVNDLLNSVTATAFAANIAAFVDSMKDNGITTIIQSVPPQSINNQTYNDSLQAIATRFSVPYIDINTYLKAGSGGVDRNTKYDKDGVHYNDLGYELWANIVEKNIKSLLKAKPAFVLDQYPVTGRAKGYIGMNDRNQPVFVQSGSDPGYIFNKAWVNGNTIADAQDASIFIKGTIYSGDDVVFVGAGTTSSPSFKVVKSTGVTTMSSAAIGTLNLNGGTFSNSGPRIFMTSGDLVGFQHGMLISRLYPNTGSPYSLRINSDRTGGAPPSGFNILELAENGTTKSYFDRAGGFHTDTVSGYNYNVNSLFTDLSFTSKKYVDSVVALGGGGGGGITSLGGQTGATQTFTEGYGIDIASGSNNHTFTLDTATVFPAVRATIPSGGGGGGSYTFSTGLTESAGTVTNNLSTGVSGGQTATGGTAANNVLTIRGNSAASSNTATNPNITFGVGNSGSTVAGQFHNNGVFALGNVSNAQASTYAQVIRQLDNTGTNGIVIYPNANYATYMQIGFGSISTNSSTFALTNTGGAVRLNGTGGVYIGGVGTPNSTAEVGGSLSLPYSAKTGNYTLTASDYMILNSSGANTYTLPTAASITGRLYVISNADSGNTITINTTSSQTFVNITGAPTSTTIVGLGTKTFMATSANSWVLISSL